MRQIEYLSPSSISVWEQDREQFFQQYLADERPPREPQNAPMAIGSAFDAYVKSYIHEALFGKNHVDSNKFKFDTIFEAQVEKQCRDQAKVHGKYCFEQYKSSGALGDLFLELQSSVSEPRMEFEVRGIVQGYREGLESEIQGVTLLGKPDVSYISAEGCLVILDFKVNNFYGKNKISPAAHYIRLRGAGRTNYGGHKDMFMVDHKGIKINCATTLETYKPDWAQQLSIYAWLLGGGIGGDFIIAIDQVLCAPNPGSLPIIKVAEHRSLINSDWQKKIFSRIIDVWEIVHSKHIFRDMSEVDSIERCRILDGKLFESKSPQDEWFDKITKKSRF